MSETVDIIYETRCIKCMGVETYSVPNAPKQGYIDFVNLRLSTNRLEYCKKCEIQTVHQTISINHK